MIISMQNINSVLDTAETLSQNATTKNGEKLMYVIDMSTKSNTIKTACFTSFFGKVQLQK